jgi:dual specificity phosphatase 12
MLYVDEKSTTTSTDVSLIVPNLYLGSIEAACNTDYLRNNLGITHILTIEDKQLDEKFSKEFKYKFICVKDLPGFNIITVFDDCFKFIDEGSSNPCAILIHCLLGVSRSATLVLAYLMSKERKSVTDIYEFVKLKRFIRPNNGFIKQLELFEAMGYIIDKESLVYKCFMLDTLAQNIKRGANINDILNNESSSYSSIDLQQPHYKCKKCRYYLFNATNRIKHLKSYEKYDTNDWYSKLDYFKKLNSGNNLNNSVCTKEIFIEPVSWLVDKISDIEGKINCPKCDSKIGSFNWYGQKCSCHTWVVPAFHIYEQKVDYCNNSQLSLIMPKKQHLNATTTTTTTEKFVAIEGENVKKEECCEDGKK